MLSLLSVSILIRWLHLGYSIYFCVSYIGQNLLLFLFCLWSWLRLWNDSTVVEITRIYLVLLSTKMLLTKILKCQPNTAMCHHHYKRKMPLLKSMHTLMKTYGLLNSRLCFLPCSPPIIFPVR